MLRAEVATGSETSAAGVAIDAGRVSYSTTPGMAFADVQMTKPVRPLGGRLRTIFWLRTSGTAGGKL